MRRAVLILFLISLLSFSASASSHLSGHSTYRIEIQAQNFNPETLTINRGDLIEFFNLAGVRTLELSDGRRSGLLSATTSAIFQFNDSATFEIAGEALAGSVTVVESGAPPPFSAEALAAEGETVFVVAQEFEFSPAELTVSPGDTVVWENIGAQAHSVDFLDGDNKVINGAATHNRTFIQPGEYRYQCKFHPAMRGVVRVLDPNAAPTPSPQAASASTGPKSVPVNIQSLTFGPNTITINTGDSVVWTNSDAAPHTATATSGPVPFDTGIFNQGQTATVTFNTAGTYDYTCNVHPSMKARIIVQDVAAAASVAPPVAETPTAAPPPSSPAPEQNLDNRLLQLRAELKEEIKAATAHGDASGVQTTVSTLQTELAAARSDVDALRQRTAQVEEIARNPPTLEIPAPQAPLVAYLSLAIDLVLVIAIIALGVYVLKGGGPRGNSPTLSEPKTGISSVVKGKEEKTAISTTTSANPDSTPSSTETTSQDPTEKYIATCRAKGLTDEQIVAQFVKSGWTSEQAKARVEKK